MVKSLKAQWQVENTTTYFRHRVVLIADESEVVATSEWVPCDGVARVEFEGRTFCAATDFHDEGLPTNRVFEVVTKPTWNTRSMV